MASPQQTSFVIPKRTYKWVSDDIESLEEYKKGGYHPIDIGDEIRDGRYRIVYKLGYGSYSTVWLARDQQQNRFVSLKFLRADAPQGSSEIPVLRLLSTASGDWLENHPGRLFVLKMLDEFEVQGENGCHRCIVTEALGPSVTLVKYETVGGQLPKRISRKVAAQCAKGLAYLHSCGVVHGDLHNGNVLFKIHGLNSWTVEQLYENFGEPDKVEIKRTDGQPVGPAAPKYAVESPDPIRLLDFCLTDECSIQIADFGEAFLTASQEMPKILNTPMSFAAPEIVFKDDVVSTPVDIWALACTLFEILGNHKLLESFLGERDEILIEMVRTLGKLPDRWWHKWEQRSTYFEEDGAFKPGSGDMSGEQRTVGLKERVGDIVRGTDGLPHDFNAQELLALEQMFVGMLRYEPAERIQAEEVVRLLPTTWENVLSAEEGA